MHYVVSGPYCIKMQRASAAKMLASQLDAHTCVDRCVPAREKICVKLLFITSLKSHGPDAERRSLLVLCFYVKRKQWGVGMGSRLKWYFLLFVFFSTWMMDVFSIFD